MSLKLEREIDSIAAMNKQVSFGLAVVCLALITGCAMFQESGQPAVVGTWTNALGTVWAIKADGTFQVSLTKSHKVDVWGKYSLAGDSMTILEAHGSHTPKACKGKAEYKFRRDGDSLTFTKVSDKCKLREKNVLLPWKPWKG
jgi:hypothetical protein